MRLFLLRVLLFAFVWAALRGSFGPVNLVVGAVLAAALLWYLRPLYEGVAQIGRAGSLRTTVGRFLRVFWLLELLAFFFYELVRSSLTVARQVLSPRLRVRPGVIALQLDARSGLEITVLANLISLTPGTLSLDVSDDNEVLYVHSMLVDGEDAVETREYIKRTLERRVIRTLGRSEGPG